MRVISKARLTKFWQVSSHKDSKGPLRAWYTHVNNKSVVWHSWSDLKAAFGGTSIIGNCVVFDIGGNEYRRHPTVVRQP
jgi:mRNA-degrading endonuclease HigB of HigAB toxin-antitoxin module